MNGEEDGIGGSLVGTRAECERVRACVRVRESVSERERVRGELEEFSGMEWRLRSKWRAGVGIEDGDGE